MKKTVLLFMLLVSMTVFSQMAGMGVNRGFNEPVGKLRVGGGMGASFGNNFGSFSIFPQVGYMLSPKVEGGLLGGYHYTRWFDTKTNMFSVGPYLNFFPIPMMFLTTRYEYFTGNMKIRGQGTFHHDEDALWLGGGYSTVGRVSFFTGIMYNVLWNHDSMFANGFMPIVGMTAGF